jgi:hypothetical protein
MASPSIRITMLRVRMSKDERAMLNDLAEREGLTASDYVRMAIRMLHRTGADVKPTLAEVLAPSFLPIDRESQLRRKAQAHAAGGGAVGKMISRTNRAVAADNRAKKRARRAK